MQAIEEINKTIGVRLVAIMATQSVPRNAIVDALNITAVRLRRIEHGLSPLSAAELVLAAKTLGVTSSILTGEEPFGSAAR